MLSLSELRSFCHDGMKLRDRLLHDRDVVIRVRQFFFANLETILVVKELMSQHFRLILGLVDALDATSLLVVINLLSPCTGDRLLSSSVAALVLLGCGVPPPPLRRPPLYRRLHTCQARLTPPRPKTPPLLPDTSQASDTGTSARYISASAASLLCRLFC